MFNYNSKIQIPLNKVNFNSNMNNVNNNYKIHKNKLINYNSLINK